MSELCCVCNRMFIGVSILVLAQSPDENAQDVQINQLLDDKSSATEEAVSRLAESEASVVPIKDPFYNEVVEGIQAATQQLAETNSDAPDDHICSLLRSIGVSDPEVS